MTAIADDEDTLQLAREIMEEISLFVSDTRKSASSVPWPGFARVSPAPAQAKHREWMICAPRLIFSLLKLQPTARNTDL